MNHTKIKFPSWMLPLLAGILLLLCHSKYSLSITKYTISADNLPRAFDGYRIVQLSDLHGTEFGENNQRLIAAVKKLSPRLIALTGDFIECKDHILRTQALVSQLTDLAPVYFVSGNHDWSSGAIQSLQQAITASGGHVLSNEVVLIENQGETLLLAGAEDPNGPADMPTPDTLLESISATHPHSYIILLAHRNDYIDKYPLLPCDLILTGHGHGGVVRLPLIGGLLGTERNLFPTYDAGCFRSGRYTMIVSRGLGGSTPVPRFLNAPEIVCVTLEKK